jgi:hypothetical protein
MNFKNNNEKYPQSEQTQQKSKDFKYFAYN